MPRASHFASLFATLTVALLALACAGGLGVPSDDGGQLLGDAAVAEARPVPAADFCARLVALVCVADDVCCEGRAPAETTCEAHQAEACAATVEPLLSDPRTGYDPARGGAYLEALHERSIGCFVEPVRLADFLAVFGGTGVEGADCTPPSTSAADLRVSHLSCGGGLACHLYRRSDGEARGVCEPRRDEACSHRYDCPAGTWCDLPEGWEPGRWGDCRPLRADGWACETAHECQSGHCNRAGACAPVPEEHHCTAMTYRAAVLADLPVGYWRFEESTPTGELRDESGHGEHGTYEGTLELVDGALNGDSARALAIDAIGEGAIVAELERHFADRSVTLEAWVRRSAESANGPLIDVGDEDALGVRLWLHSSSDRVYGNLCDDDGESRPMQSEEGRIEPERWYHVALTYDGSEGRLYVDGEQVEDPLAERFDPRTSGALRIGHRVADERFITGAIDEVAIYARRLSPTQVRRHARIGHDGADAHDFALFGWLR